MSVASERSHLLVGLEHLVLTFVFSIKINCKKNFSSSTIRSKLQRLEILQS